MAPRHQNPPSIEPLNSREEVFARMPPAGMGRCRPLSATEKGFSKGKMKRQMEKQAHKPHPRFPSPFHGEGAGGEDMRTPPPPPPFPLSI